MRGATIVADRTTSFQVEQGGGRELNLDHSSESCYRTSRPPPTPLLNFEILRTALGLTALFGACEAPIRAQARNLRNLIGACEAPIRAQARHLRNLIGVLFRCGLFPSFVLLIFELS